MELEANETNDDLLKKYIKNHPGLKNVKKVFDIFLYIFSTTITIITLANKDNTVIKIYTVWFVIASIILFLFGILIVYCYYKINCKEKIITEKDQEIKELNKNFQNNLKEYSEKSKKILELINNCNNFVIETYYKMQYNKYDKSFVRDFEIYCNHISKIFQSFTGEEVTVSIRFFKSVIPNRIKESKFVTLAYSQNCAFERKSEFERQRNDDIFTKVVAKNMDFAYSIDPSDGKRYFYASNLEEVDNFFSETDDYLEFYKGRIVIPIEMKNDILFTEEQSNVYETIGFLVVDSLSTQIFDEEHKSIYIQFLQSQVQLLYMLLKSFQASIFKIDDSYNRKMTSFERLMNIIEGSKY